jgi:succinate dehydrogenase/fumarate reductase cytochrome b subunit
MNVTLLRALAALILACLLLCGSMVMYVREKTASRVLQVVGAGGLVLVVLSHVCEAVRWLPWMGWGLENSPGHYLDLSSAVLGVTLFPVGYFLHALTKQPTSRKKAAG